MYFDVLAKKLNHLCVRPRLFTSDTNKPSRVPYVTQCYRSQMKKKTAHFSFGENGCIEGRLRMMSLDVNGSVDLNSRTHSLFE